MEEEETPSGAAHRLCLEEAGLDVKLTVLIQIYRAIDIEMILMNHR